MPRFNAAQYRREITRARRRGNPWLTADVSASERTEYAEYAEMVMGHIDHWPARWRALANHYGYEIVSELISGGDPMVAWGQLEARRLRRQEEWLATDYHPKRIAGK